MHMSKDGKTYHFERCVLNKFNRQLWIDWSSTGLAGYTNPGDASYVYFNEESDNHDSKPEDLWYGPRPDKLDPVTVLRPNEARAETPRPRVNLVADSQTVDIESAFQDPTKFVQLMNSLPEGRLIFYAGGRLAMPTRASAVDDLRDADKKIALTDFVPVNVEVHEIISSHDGAPLSTLDLIIWLDKGTLEELKGENLPLVNISTDDSDLNERLNINKIYSFLKPDVTSIIRLRDSAPRLLSFPITRAHAKIFVDSGNPDKKLILNFSFARSKAD
jgi:hypothetical protein